jgi:hypothetical protein
MSRPTRLTLLSILAVLAVTLIPATAGADHTPYSTHVSNSIAGGDPGYFYVGGPLNATLRDAEERDQRYELCMTPAPIDRDPCATGRTGRPITGLAPSEVGRTKLRFEVPEGPVIVRYINVREAGGHGARETGRIRVCADELDVFAEPNRRYVGQLAEGESMKVRKYSASGKYAYGFAYGDANKMGWVLSSGLCRA